MGGPPVDEVRRGDGAQLGLVLGQLPQLGVRRGARVAVQRQPRHVRHRDVAARRHGVAVGEALGVGVAGARGPHPAVTLPGAEAGRALAVSEPGVLPPRVDGRARHEADPPPLLLLLLLLLLPVALAGAGVVAGGGRRPRPHGELPRLRGRVESGHLVGLSPLTN